MKYHNNLFWGVAVVPILFLFTGCKYLPLSKPGESSEKISNPVETPVPVIPPLSSAEFLKDSTYVGPDGALHSIKDKKPVTGVLVAFHPNGRKKSEINYIDGLREGSAQWWAITGRLKHIRNYHRGELSGSWTEYYGGSDQKRQEQIYDNGIEIMRRGWWPNGKKKFEATFLNGEGKPRQSWDASGVPIHENPTSAPAPTTPVNPKKQP